MVGGLISAVFEDLRYPISPIEYKKLMTHLDIPYVLISTILTHLNPLFDTNTYLYMK